MPSFKMHDIIFVGPIHSRLFAFFQQTTTNPRTKKRSGRRWLRKAAGLCSFKAQNINAFGPEALNRFECYLISIQLTGLKRPILVESGQPINLGATVMIRNHSIQRSLANGSFKRSYVY